MKPVDSFDVEPDRKVVSPPNACFTEVSMTDKIKEQRCGGLFMLHLRVLRRVNVHVRSQTGQPSHLRTIMTRSSFDR